MQLRRIRIGEVGGFRCKIMGNGMRFDARAALRRCGSTVLALIMGVSLVSAEAAANDAPPAKELFGAKDLPMQAAPASFGFYSKVGS